jgi:CDP-diacylglycerol--serine O-phosphatidyltransferase
MMNLEPSDPMTPGGWRPLVPNAITLLSMACGVISICLSFTGEPLEAGWWILYATLLDRMDGMVARALKATSPLGAALDSFSDFAAFGLAPAFLAFAVCGGAFDLPVVVPMIIYIAGCALRLARFGLAPEKKLFEGVASTMAGGVFAVAMIVALTHRLPQVPQVAPVLLVLFGVAMNVPWLRYNKVGGGNSKVARYTLLGLAAFCMALILVRALPEVLLAITATLMVLGPAITAWDQRARG